jgi:hypothetical protein
MPLVKIVKPLFKLCIKSITTNLEISDCVDKLNIGNKLDNNLVGISKISNYPFIHQLRKFPNTCQVYLARKPDTFVT